VRTGGSTKYMYQGRYKSLNSLQKKTSPWGQQFCLSF
jgi:hypothetical protein